MKIYNIYICLNGNGVNMGILSKILYVFTKEYENDVENQIFLEKK